MYILPILLLCPAAGAREMWCRLRGLLLLQGVQGGRWGGPVGLSGRRPGVAIPARIRMSL